MSEDGQWSKTDVGMPQGSVISPFLANVYLHYVLDLWVNQWRKKSAKGDAIIVRYADDFVLGFQHRHEAERFLSELRERLEKFGLRLHPEKTRLIEFGRLAALRRWERGRGRRESFDFLGFTHRWVRKRGKEGFVVHGSAGRDHWPDCYTALVAGGGVNGGAIYGSSDKTRSAHTPRPNR